MILNSRYLYLNYLLFFVGSYPGPYLFRQTFVNYCQQKKVNRKPGTEYENCCPKLGKAIWPCPGQSESCHTVLLRLYFPKHMQCMLQKLPGIVNRTIMRYHRLEWVVSYCLETPEILQHFLNYITDRKYLVNCWPRKLPTNIYRTTLDGNIFVLKVCKSEPAQCNSLKNSCFRLLQTTSLTGVDEYGHQTCKRQRSRSPGGQAEQGKPRWCLQVISSPLGARIGGGIHVLGYTSFEDQDHI